jgi:hypothetical protein
MHSSIAHSYRQPLARLLVGALVVLQAAMVAPVASAQCADPRGNSYCQNGGQVTFSAPPAQSSLPPTQPQPTPADAAGQATSPAVQSNAPAAAAASISLDPPTAPAGATVIVSGQGLGGGRSAWVNLSHMMSTGGLNLGAKQLATVNTAPDGSLNATVTIPTVPSWTAGSADICVINATAQPVCAPFTLGSAGPPVDDTVTTPDGIVGHYQCSSALLVGFGGGFCTGSEPILALNGDGTYSWGDEQGGWSFDGTTVSFDGGLGSGTVQNRRLTVQSDLAMPDGSTQTVRYTYIRMNY